MKQKKVVRITESELRRIISENIKQQSEEDEIFDKLKGNFSSPVAEHALLVKLVQLSRDYTHYDSSDIAYAAEKALYMIQSGKHTDSYDFGDNEDSPQGY
jgi:hypothetical protein